MGFPELLIGLWIASSRHFGVMTGFIQICHHSYQTNTFSSWPAAAGLQSYSRGRAACGGLWVLGGGGCAGWGGGCGWSTQEWEFENILHLGSGREVSRRAAVFKQLQNSSALEEDYSWCRKGRKYSIRIYFVNLHVPSILSKWIAAAQPAAPTACTLGLLFSCG